jgi:hypothetical protein
MSVFGTGVGAATGAIGSAGGPLVGAVANVNAPNFVQNFSDAIQNSTIIIPEGVEQIASFAFDYRETEEVLLESEITEHWLEDNTTASDHIGVRPTVVTLTGWVVELNMPKGILLTILGALQSATNSLSVLPVFLGAKTPGAAQKIEQAISQAQNVVVQVEQAVARAAQLANLLSGLLGGDSRDKQQKAYLQLKAYQQARIIFTVVTPFETHINMAIESIRATQPSDSTGWSKFIVRMKQINFVGDNNQPNYSATLSSPVASAQGQAATTNGATTGSSGPTVSSNLAVPAR